MIQLGRAALIILRLEIIHHCRPPLTPNTIFNFIYHFTFYHYFFNLSLIKIDVQNVVFIYTWSEVLGRVGFVINYTLPIYRQQPALLDLNIYEGLKIFTHRSNFPSYEFRLKKVGPHLHCRDGNMGLRIKFFILNLKRQKVFLMGLNS